MAMAARRGPYNRNECPLCGPGSGNWAGHTGAHKGFPFQARGSPRGSQCAAAPAGTIKDSARAMEQLEEDKAALRRANAKLALVFYARKEGSTGSWHKFSTVGHAHAQLPISQYSAEEASARIDACCQGKRESFGGYVFRKLPPADEKEAPSSQAVARKDKLHGRFSPSFSVIFNRKCRNCPFSRAFY